MFKNQGYLINIVPSTPSSSTTNTSSFSTSSSTILNSVLDRFLPSALNPKTNTNVSTTNGSGSSRRITNNECIIYILFKRSCTNTELLQGLLHCYLLQIELYNTPTSTHTHTPTTSTHTLTHTPTTSPLTHTLTREYIIHVLTQTLNYVQNIECSSTSLDTSEHHWIRTFFNRLIGGPQAADGVTSSGRLVIVYV